MEHEITLKRVQFTIEVELQLPYVEGRTNITTEIRDMINDSLPGLEYWDFAENGSPVVTDSHSLRVNTDSI